MSWKPDTFRGALLLLIIDKVVIVTLIGIVSWKVYNSIEERRHQEQLKLSHATLAGQLLPTISDTTLAVDDWARLLSVLSNAEAIQPHIAAQYGQKLVEENVSKRIFVQAISHSMQIDAKPFLREAALIVWKHIKLLKLLPENAEVPDCNVNYQGSRVTSIHDPNIDLNMYEERTDLAHWRHAFATYLDPNIQASVRDQLNSKKFLTERVPNLPWELENVKFFRVHSKTFPHTGLSSGPTPYGASF